MVNELAVLNNSTLLLKTCSIICLNQKKGFTLGMFRSIFGANELPVSNLK